MGLTLILLTGLVWGAIGILMGVVARRRLDIFVFTAAGTLLGSVAAWVVFPQWTVLLEGQIPRGSSLILFLSIAGIAGVCGMLCLQKAMIAGAVAWTVGQSAMVIPFLWGVLFLGEPLRLFGMIGLGAILASLLMFSFDGKGLPGADRRWLPSALFALILLGTQQTLSSIPSSWPDWSDSAGLRVPLVLTSGALPLVLICIARRRRPESSIWGLAAIYAALVVVGQFLLFAAMDQLRAEGRLALAFPLALSTCIILVALFDWLKWKNRLGATGWAGIALGLLGVILLALAAV